MYYQTAGGICSLCKSSGTNKTTCPLNPIAINPNHEKHPLASAAASIPKVKLPVEIPKVNIPKAVVRKDTPPQKMISQKLLMQSLLPQDIRQANNFRMSEFNDEESTVKSQLLKINDLGLITISSDLAMISVPEVDVYTGTKKQYRGQTLMSTTVQLSYITGLIPVKYVGLQDFMQARGLQCDVMPITKSPPKIPYVTERIDYADPYDHTTVLFTETVSIGGFESIDLNFYEERIDELVDGDDYTPPSPLLATLYNKKNGINQQYVMLYISNDKPDFFDKVCDILAAFVTGGQSPPVPPK
jgi:hypothetical protein